MILTIGIDPGKTGGIAWSVGHHAMAVAEKIPATEKDISDLLAGLNREDHEVFAYIERVGASPQMGVTSSFTFGRGYGFLRGCLITLGIAFEEVTPHVWQRDMHCRSGGDKNVTKAMAQQLHPHLKVTHAIADSLLIHEWGRRRRARDLGGVQTPPDPKKSSTAESEPAKLTNGGE